MCSQCLKERYYQTYEADRLGVIRLITKGYTTGILKMVSPLMLEACKPSLGISLPGFPMEELMMVK